MPKLEVCIDADNIAVMEKNIRTAIDAGAQRIELCAAMASDGLTPKTEAIQAAKLATGDATLLVMIRPRAGDFCYNKDEVSLMCEQITMAKQAGADGVVFGLLNNQQELDLVGMSQMMPVAKTHKLPVTFHRAFDCIDNWRLAALQLIELGVSRVLTSGTAWDSSLGAQFGLNKLQQLISLTDDQLEIVIGGGISVENTTEICQSCTEFGTNLSLHTFSGVLENGVVCAEKVKAICNNTL